MSSPLPHVGEMYRGRVMTVAMHRRLLVEQIAAHEMASGDSELIRIAKWRLEGKAPLVISTSTVPLRRQVLTREFWLQRRLPL